MLDTAVAFIFFNKIDTTKKVFEQICKAKPKKLYLISDGARADKQGEAEIVNDLRAWVESHIDWDAEVVKLYAEKNMGCRNRVVSGLNAVFEREEYAIILEDDCLPKQSFFRFAEEMLIRYKDFSQVMAVAGSNLLPISDYEITGDYTFSSNVFIWGWATWARAWKLYDIEIKTWPEVRDQHLLDTLNDGNMRYSVEWVSGFEDVYNGRLDTWDYQWYYSILTHSGLTIVPKYNLIENLGFSVEEATHTTDTIPEYLQNVYKVDNDIEFPIKMKDYIIRDQKYDKAYDYAVMKVEYSLKGRAYRKYLALREGKRK